jgi:ribosomal protein S18 acetylase RimI-like enzyme
MAEDIRIRGVTQGDFDAWRKLWHGFAAFNGYAGEPPVEAEITEVTWARFLEPAHPLSALVAQREDGALLGFAHYVFYNDSLSVEPVCYLEDLYTAEAARRQGIARRLVAAVAAAARAAGATQIYWVVPQDNAAARALYDSLSARADFVVYGMEL